MKSSIFEKKWDEKLVGYEDHFKEKIKKYIHSTPKSDEQIKDLLTQSLIHVFSLYTCHISFLVDLEIHRDQIEDIEELWALIKLTIAKSDLQFRDL